jgi:3'(2'), 5'-bisphosphate nucleotidase
MRPTPELLQTLCTIASAAGRAVLEVYAGDFGSSRKDDGSPVTEADLRADALICEGLARAFPGVFVRSEESVSTPPAGSVPGWFLVDPLDGTREFLARNGEFTVNIALIQGGEDCDDRGGRPVAGVVLAPALDALYVAAQGLGAWRRAWSPYSPDEAQGPPSGDFAPGAAGPAAGAWQPLRVAPAPAGPVRALVSRSHLDPRTRTWLAALPRGHVALAAGSSLKFCRIAEGAADLYPRFGPTSPWDTAAGQCVLECAGGAVLALDGRPLRYDPHRTARNPDFLALGDPALGALPGLPQAG